ncbi:MAG: hypothetical protein ABIO52_01555 [Gemmatimonadaceae bacterium]
MLPLIVFAQIASADNVYSSSRLRGFVSEAAIQNHAPPQEFRGYTAKVETEMSLLTRDTLGRERAAQIEQLASTVKWTRGSDYGMHVVGYRAQSLGPTISSLSFLTGWTEPSLYGERILLGAQFITDSARIAKRKSNGDSLSAVHPFASDRDRYYRFSGGDTVTTLRSPGREIPIVRIHVTPHLSGATRFAAFDGEIDVDATRHQIVRMRGQFVVLGKRKSGKSMVERVPGLVAVAYSEFVNAEIDQRYWLPATQRTEFQTTLALLGRDRAVMRIVSKFNNYIISDSSSIAGALNDSLHIPHRTTWARSDSVSHFNEWTAQLGEATTTVSSGDFDDVAPDAWKATGSSRVELVPTNWDNLVRYNRVEGLFTGAELNVRMRSQFPGLSYGGAFGWAWTEKTLKGALHASLKRNLNTYAVGAERSLASTNDFVLPGEGKSDGINGLIASFDDFDYVDRRSAVATVSHIVGFLDNALITAQAGAGSDRNEIARLDRGIFAGGHFRPNRGVDEGSYALGVLEAELHPSASEEFVQPGFGAHVRYEAGRGGLNWQRTDVGLSGREYWGPILLSLHADGGIVTGKSIPPQKLFELGGSSILPGYSYKEFAGNQSLLFRGYSGYTFPILRAPRRVWRSLYMPGLAPGFAAGIQGGWARLSSGAARESLARLNASSGTPVSRETDGIRATFGFGVTFLSGNFHLGVARPVDRGAKWRLAAGFGPSF